MLVVQLLTGLRLGTTSDRSASADIEALTDLSGFGLWQQPIIALFDKILASKNLTRRWT